MANDDQLSSNIQRRLAVIKKEVNELFDELDNHFTQKSETPAPASVSPTTPVEVAPAPAPLPPVAPSPSPIFPAPVPPVAQRPLTQPTTKREDVFAAPTPAVASSPSTSKQYPFIDAPPTSRPNLTVPVPKRAPKPSETDDSWLLRIFIFFGGALVLGGIIFLIVLSARSGYFGPVPRTITLAAFSGALIGVGARIRQKAFAAGIASASLGLTGLYLTVISMTTIYQWIPDVSGLAFAVVIALLGMELSRMWNVQALSITNVTAVIIATPIITNFAQPTIVWFFIVLAALALHPLLTKPNWTALGAVVLGPVLFFASINASQYTIYDREDILFAVLGAVILIWGFAAYLTPKVNNPLYLRIYSGLAAIPVFSLLDSYNSSVQSQFYAVGADVENAVSAIPVTAAICLGLAVALTTTGILLRKTLESTSYIFYGISSILVMYLTFVAFDGNLDVMFIVAEALALAVLTRVLKSRIMLVIALGFGVVSLANLFLMVLPFALFDRYEISYSTSPEIVITAVLLVAWTVLNSNSVFNLFPQTRDRLSVVLPYALVSIYGLAVAFIYGSVLTLDGQQTIASPYASEYGQYDDYGYYSDSSNALAVPNADMIPGVDGFLVGHMLTTLSFAVVSFLILGRFLQTRSRVLRTTGLTILSITIIKVIFLDVSVLDGIPRVLAYIGVGLILLTLGAKYGRQLSAPVSKQDHDEPVLVSRNAQTLESQEDGSEDDFQIEHPER